MSENQATMPSPAAEMFGEARRNWGWLVALGGISLALGAVCLGSSLFALTMVSVVFFGWLILVTGVVELVQAFKCRGWRSFIWQLIVAALHVLAGVFVVANPVPASTIFTLLLGASILGGGIARIVVAFQHRGHGSWIWPLMSGAIGALLGLMILSRWPESSLFVIGLFIAIELVVNGWSMVMLGLAAKASDGAEARVADATA